ncbi:MAG: polyphosphate polymerase domain-containing protein [Planctomycetota bacterium]
MKPPAADGTLRSRYECKYVVEEALLEPLRSTLRTFLAPDAYSAQRPDGRYRISSLYLDSPRLALYRDTVDGKKNRFKLRLRCYDDGATPVFCEVKKRMDGIVYKRRSAVPRDAVRAFLDGDLFAAERAADDDDAREFSLLARTIVARPTVRVRYWREAYESTGADPVRVTFDTDLDYACSPAGELSVEDGEWGPTSLAKPILEIKFTNTFPVWLADVARRFGLVRTSVAKYVLCLGAARRSPLGASLYQAG